MKRFIVISLLATLGLQAFPCAWMDTHNYYLFSLREQEEFSTRVDRVTCDNWKSYLGMDADKYFWFDADEVAEAAQRKGDALMVSYVRQLQRYLECANEVAREQWDYPTKEQLAQRRLKLQSVRSYAQGKLRTRLRGQHALLFMRCNMMLGRHAENVAFWEQTASQYIETVYRDMMRNIYAGALLKTGHADEAGELFAEMGDWHSLMTQYYKQRSCQAIRQEYQRNPDSAVLPFLLQAFVNNAQEAFDAENDMGMEGKLFIRKILRSEARQMQQLASQAVGEGRSHSPAMWKTAQAWLEYLFGNRQQALTLANQAIALEGTECMKDNARVLKIYIHAAQSSVSQQFDDWLAGELEWLKTMKGDEHYAQVMDRLVHQVLASKYLQAGRQEIALSLYRMDAGDYCYQAMLDTMRVESLLAYLDYVRRPATTALDRSLKPCQQVDEVAMNDLIGTKYMRLCQWDEAVRWLSRVPMSFVNDRGYAVYAAHRRYDVEPWLTRQWLKAGMEYGGEQQHMTVNPKLKFAQEVQQMESGLNVLSGKARQQRCYDLAVRYAQAHFTGDCWFLMRNGKSVSDTRRINETDLAAKALAYLREASQASDFLLKEKALFAMSYCYLHDGNQAWYTNDWDEQASDYVWKPRVNSTQYRAFAALTDFEQANASRTSPYVSRCDEYIQFRKRCRK